MAQEVSNTDDSEDDIEFDDPSVLSPPRRRKTQHEKQSNHPAGIRSLRGRMMPLAVSKAPLESVQRKQDKPSLNA